MDEKKHGDASSAKETLTRIIGPASAVYVCMYVCMYGHHT